MAKKESLLSVAETILEESKSPMSSKEIWLKACEKKMVDEKDYESKKTEPHYLIYNGINQDIRTKPDSVFVRVSKNPILFALKSNETATAEKAIKNKIEEIEKNEEKIIQDIARTDLEYNEADLHPILAKYVDFDGHFNCSVKTIKQQRANHRRRRANIEPIKDEWMFPDLIGVYLPYDDYEEETTKFINSVYDSTIKVFSFEVKKKINGSTLRMDYFQAVSNSSWANEGYLVAPDISDDPEFIKELSLLNNSFGIGVIKLNVWSPSESQIIISAKPRERIDIDILDKLVNRSPDVSDLFKAINVSVSAKQRLELQSFDKVFTDDEYDEITKDGIMGIGNRKK